MEKSDNEFIGLSEGYSDEIGLGFLVMPRTNLLKDYKYHNVTLTDTCLTGPQSRSKTCQLAQARKHVVTAFLHKKYLDSSVAGVLQQTCAEVAMRILVKTGL